jgi:hypothetical protein
MHLISHVVHVWMCLFSKKQHDVSPSGGPSLTLLARCHYVAPCDGLQSRNLRCYAYSGRDMCGAMSRLLWRLSGVCVANVSDPPCIVYCIRTAVGMHRAQRIYMVYPFCAKKYFFAKKSKKSQRTFC